ncbi:MAG: hypothetical protein QXO70_04565 [Candidatus Pacearchaeota archaeon]
MDNVTQEMVEIGKKLVELRNKKDDLNSELTKLNEEIDKIETELATQMALSQIQNFQIENVGKFILSRKLYPQIINKEDFFKWLKRHRLGGIIKTDIPHQTLKKWVEEREQYLKDKNKKITIEEELNGLVSFYEKIGVQIRDRKKLL